MQSRLLTNSKVTTTARTPSESRIIQKKNIQKRLQNLSLKQLERIHINLNKQNQRLKEEVQTFSEKVKKLIQSKKFQTQIKPNPLVQDQILKTKNQLQNKYSIMKELKEQIKKQQSKIIIEEISTNQKQKINSIKLIELQLKQLAKEKQKLNQSIKNNQKDFQQYLPAKDLSAQIEVLKEDSKNLKKKIYDISFKIKDNQKSAKQALTKIYTLKKQTFTLQNNKISRIKSLSVMGKYQTATEDFQSAQLKSLRKNLYSQISLLKKQKVDMQSQLTYEKATKQSVKNKKQQQVAKLLDYHKKLSKKKTRQLTELNFLKKKQAQLIEQKMLQLQKSKIPLLERGIQTQKFIKKEYRKDWIGRNEGLQFNDTQILQFKQSCLIKSLLVYRTTDRIVFIRFGYENQSNKYKYETKIPFDKEGLRKIDNKKITSKNNGHLVNLTVSITKQIVTRIESHWSDGDSSVQGWETQQSNKYKFDILQKQRPIAFYGTLTPHPKGFYALESLGCQIFQNNQ